MPVGDFRHAIFTSAYKTTCTVYIDHQQEGIAGGGHLGTGELQVCRLSSAHAPVLDHCRLTRSSLLTGLRILALDAAMPFDFEARAQQQMQSQQHLRVGIVGFGKFGQFLARRLIAAGHQVSSSSRGWSSCAPCCWAPGELLWGTR